jgi:hypothetical protein
VRAMRPRGTKRDRKRGVEGTRKVQIQGQQRVWVMTRPPRRTARPAAKGCVSSTGPPKAARRRTARSYTRSSVKRTSGASATVQDTWHVKGRGSSRDAKGGKSSRGRGPSTGLNSSCRLFERTGECRSATSANSPMGPMSKRPAQGRPTYPSWWKGKGRGKAAGAECKVQGARRRSRWGRDVVVHERLGRDDDERAEFAPRPF